MQHCKFCGEPDESRLILSSRFVNGKVEQELVCFRCFWRDKFVHEAEGEDDRTELRYKEKICGNRGRDSQKNGTFLFSERHAHEIFCNKINRERTKAL